MFTRIVMQASGRLTALSIRALAWLKELLWKAVSYLLASFILVFLSAAKLYNLAARIVLSTKAWLVSLTTVAQSIKAELTSAKAKATLLGQQALTTVRQTSQLALTLLKQKKDKLVALIKLAPSPSSESKTALTPTEVQLIQAGLKSQGRAKQRQRLAKQASKTKR